MLSLNINGSTLPHSLFSSFKQHPLGILTISILIFLILLIYLYLLSVVLGLCAMCQLTLVSVCQLLVAVASLVAEHRL